LSTVDFLVFFFLLVDGRGALGFSAAGVLGVLGFWLERRVLRDGVSTTTEVRAPTDAGALRLEATDRPGVGD